MNLSFVVDASVVFALQFPDEDNDPVEAIISRIIKHGAVIPVHWHAEIANSFAMAVRRNRMSAHDRDGALQRMVDLPIATDETSRLALWGETQNLADQYKMTACDAAYLELSLRRNLPLATLDNALSHAASAAGVEVLGTQS